MKFMILFDFGNETDEITVVTEQGGLVCIQRADPISNLGNGEEKPRIAVSDYYQMLITEDPTCTADNLFECLAEGLIYHKDWPDVSYNSLTAITDALNWLSPNETTWEMTDDLFPDIFPR